MAAPTTAPSGKTINVFGKKIPKTPALVVGGGAAAFVGYRWWQSGREIPAPTGQLTDELPEPVEEPTDQPGFDVTGGGGRPGTNEEWWDMAVFKMELIGYDSSAVSTAIGRFIDRKPLNKADAEIMRQVIAAAGYPPENGPWTLIEEGPPPITPGLLAPANFKATGAAGSAHLSWDAVAGATGYQTRLGNADSGFAWKAVSGTTETVPFPAGAKGTYTFAVRAVGPNGTLGPAATATAAVTATGGPSGPLGRPQLAFNSDRNTIGISVSDPTGKADSYYVTRVGGGRGVKHRIGERHRSDNLRPNRNYVFRIRLAKGNVTGPVRTMAYKTQR